MLQESHKKDKHLGCSLSKILRTTDVDEGITFTNEPENKKTNDYE